MSIEFNPMTDEEARKAESNCFDEGTYQFLVIECEARTSKKGNAMLAVVLEVRTDIGKRKVRDWVMLDGQMAWQLKKFCECIGLADKYASGKLDEDEMVGLFGVAEFYIEEDAQYGDKNRVGKYLPSDGPPKREKKSPAENAEQIDEDDIPF